MWQWIGNVVGNVVGSALGQLAWNTFGDKLKGFYSSEEAESVSYSNDLPRIPEAPRSAPRRYQPISSRQQGPGPTGKEEAIYTDGLPEAISVAKSDLESLRQEADSIASSQESARLSLEAATASLTSTNASLEAIERWLGNKLGSFKTPAPALLIKTGVTDDPYPVTLPMNGDEHPGKALTSADRQKMLLEELSQLLGQEAKTTPAVTPRPITRPPLVTSERREPLLSPTPSSANGSSPESRIRSMLANSQLTNAAPSQVMPVANINPSVQTPPASLPSQSANSVPLTPPPVPTLRNVPEIPPSASIERGGPCNASAPPAVGTTTPATVPDLSQLLQRIASAKAAAAPVPLTEENVSLFNGKSDAVGGAKDDGEDDDANTVRSGDSKASSVVSDVSDKSDKSDKSAKSDHSVATSIGSGRGAK
ncbi:hypothetical protein NCC49_000237 [Naganishia albida]|nr:hypothetical protein NCC49_000237 [Naganishia albida]